MKYSLRDDMNRFLKRRWFQFSLKGMLVVVTLVAVGLGWLAYERNKVRKREAAISAIEQVGGIVVVDGEPTRPSWLRPVLGDNSGGGVVEVDFSEVKVTDAGLAHVAVLAELRFLRLNNAQLTDAGLTHLAGLSKIESLTLSGDHQITNAGLTNLIGLKELKDLFLRDTQVTDAGLNFLAGLTKLEVLGLDNTQLTDAGLVHLRGLTKLSWLRLNGTQVTDAGLTHLTGLTALKVLDLFDTHVTDQGVSKLQKALPNLEIIR
jgi:Leucine-rich repeat (LRR) protein